MSATRERNHRRPTGAAWPPPQTVLVLQGGGALGAYQAGVYEALDAAGCRPDWVAGISIGAINAALIAGNPPASRLDRLHAFWDGVSATLRAPPAVPGDAGRAWFNDASSALAAAGGLPGFFTPRLPPALCYPPGAPQALSVYDTAPLRRTLEQLVDFDRINHGPTRLSVGAVNLRSGNFAYFDSRQRELGPEHVMASGALPPGFPPIEIDGEYYWDGGIVSNTPLQYVLDELPRPDMNIFQVDLFSARGQLPRDLAEVYEREKDIRFSSRTRLNTDVFRQGQALRRAAHRLLARLPPEFADDPDVQYLREASCNAAVTIVHLIHRHKLYHTHGKDYDFSRWTIEEHWRNGVQDVRRTLRHRAWRERDPQRDGVTVLDLTHDTDD
ncbi:MAG: patatin-like phospholipase family protein [Gammaproteobacteria bacterium]|nr:patatin-like phospholipase family protein [Gammaproteobacteria bacterium]